MGKDSKISWTHHTFNPWWGCARVSPGCENCYAEAFAKRTGKAKWGAKEERRLFGDARWAEPLKWDRAAEKAGERHRVFVASMADVFEDRRDLDVQRERLWALIAATPHLDWLLLTKRPANMPLLAPSAWEIGWPKNVWAGTTVEDQARADDRIPHLLSVPASVKFLSCEPLLESVRLDALHDDEIGARWDGLVGLDWVIVGGESGHGARPFDLAWARSVVSQCRAAGVSVFVKQLGANAYDAAMCRHLSDRAGRDMAEWPEDLRIQEFPR